uniref:Uncharacterized protein n=1 Tax=Chenopodium quinoa TaxID=63459 RepID=A0A803KVI6_CHEQI
MESNEWFPTILFPFTFEGSNNPNIVMVKVVDGKPISEFDANWFFPILKVRKDFTLEDKSFNNKKLIPRPEFDDMICKIVTYKRSASEEGRKSSLGAEYLYTMGDLHEDFVMCCTVYEEMTSMAFQQTIGSVSDNELLALLDLAPVH